MPALEQHQQAKWFWPLALGLLAVHFVAAWSLRIPGITTGGDDAVYVQLARSLLDFDYRETFYVGSPPHVKYPPGYPALLAALTVVGGERIDLFLGAGILLSVAALALLADAARRRFSPELGALFLVAVVLNPRLLSYAGMLMSEALFVFLMALSVWGAARAADSPQKKWLVLAGAAAIGAMLTRSAGVTIVAALSVTWLLQRRYRPAFGMIVAGGLGLAGWLAWTMFAPEPIPGGAGEEYIADTFLVLRKKEHFIVVEIALRAIGNASRYLTRDFPAQLPLPYVAGTVIDNVVALSVIALLSLAGLLVAVRRLGYLLAVVIAYAGLIFIWPWPVSRFFTVLIPPLLIIMLVGAAAIGERIGPKWKLALPAAFALVVGATAASALPTELARAARCDRGAPLFAEGCILEWERPFLEMTRWVADSAPANAVFITSKEGTFGYHAKRRTVPAFRILRTDSTAVLSYARRLGATHLALSEIKGEGLRMAQLFRPHCHSLAPVQELAPTALVMRIRAPGEPGDASGCTALTEYLVHARANRPPSVRG
jgi:4-amino-4-deoxy-L-arabinose transferase-like glycosyltransferase